MSRIPLDQYVELAVIMNLPVEDLRRAFGRVFTTKMAPQCRAFTGLYIEKN